MSLHAFFNHILEIPTLARKRHAVTSCPRTSYLSLTFFFFWYFNTDMRHARISDDRGWRCGWQTVFSHRYVIYGTFLTPSRWRRIEAWSVSTTMMASRRTLPRVCDSVCHASHPGRPITHRYFTRAAKLTARKISTLFIARSRLSFISSSVWPRVALILYLSYKELVGRVNWLHVGNFWCPCSFLTP